MLEGGLAGVGDDGGGLVDDDVVGVEEGRVADGVEEGEIGKGGYEEAEGDGFDGVLGGGGGEGVEEATEGRVPVGRVESDGVNYVLVVVLVGPRLWGMCLSRHLFLYLTYSLLGMEGRKEEGGMRKKVMEMVRGGEKKNEEEEG